MKSAAEIKSSIDMRAYVADDLGKPKSFSANGYIQFVCPFHSGGNERMPSLTVWDDHAHCYGSGCDFHGDVIEYVQRRLGVDFKAALEFLNDNMELPRYERRGSAPKDPAPRTILTPQDIERYHFELHRVKPYLQDRKIADAFAEIRLLGGSEWKRTYVDATGVQWVLWYNRVVIPYLWEGECYSQNFRRDDLSIDACLNVMSSRHHIDFEEFLRIDLAEKMDCDPADITREQVNYHCFGVRFYRPEHTAATAYGVEWLIRKEPDKLRYPRMPYVILTEGEFNQMSASELGFPTVALKANKHVNIRRLTQNTRMIFIAVDSDQGGQEYAEKIMIALEGDRDKARTIVMPPGFNDMNDLHRQDHLLKFLTSKPYYLEPLSEQF